MLRRGLVFSFLLLFAGLRAAQAAELSEAGRIVAVTLFGDRAQVTRELRVELAAGDHLVSLPGLPGNLLPGSLRAAAAEADDISFGALEARLHHEEAPTAPRERALTAEIEALKDRQSLLDDRIRAAELRLGFVSQLADRLPQGGLERIAGGSLDVEALERALALIDSGASKALAERREALLDKRRLAQEIEARERERANLASGARATTEVRLALAARTPGPKTLRVVYQVPGASWVPRYEARLESESGKLELLQRAEITQRSGEDWEDVALTLSTARPSSGTEMPELALWRLGFARPWLAQEGTARNAPVAAKVMADASGEEPADGLAALTASEFAAEWQVPGRVGLPADGSRHLVTLARTMLEADLLLRATPKLDAHAYLYALSHWTGEAPLLPGRMALIRDGAFVGETSLPLLRSGEEARFAFGLDDRLRLDYRVVDAKPESRGLVSKRERRERRIEIEAENLHHRPVVIELYDQLPQSGEKDISVELIEASPPPTEQSPEGRTGLLLWRLPLEAGATGKAAFAFAVEFPAGEQVSGF